MGKVPDAYTGQVKIITNDSDEDVIIMNAILLILLTVDHNDAIDTAVHTWYSARLQERHMNVLRQFVQPIVEHAIGKIDDGEVGGVFSKRIKFGDGTLRIVLNKRQWKLLASKLSSNLRAGLAERSRRFVMLGRKDHIQRSFMCIMKDQHQRLAHMHYREQGVLLPFQADTQTFILPNPYVHVFS